MDFGKHFRGQFLAALQKQSSLNKAMETRHVEENTTIKGSEETPDIWNWEICHKKPTEKSSQGRYIIYVCLNFFKHVNAQTTKSQKLSNSIIFFALFCSCHANSPCKRWLPINSFLI
jgi:hypothetical protein